MAKAKGKKPEKKVDEKKGIKEELSAMTLSGDDVLAQLKEALQVEDFQPEIELAPRVGKIVYKIDPTKVNELRNLIKTVQADKLAKNPAWQGIPLTTKKLCEIFGLEYEHDSKKKVTDDKTNVVSHITVKKEYASLPPTVEDIIQDATDEDNGFIVLERIKGGGLKDKESGKVLPAYWVKYVTPEGNPDEAETLDENAVEVETGTIGVEGVVEELNLS